MGNDIKDDIFKNIADKILLINEKENKNIIEQRIKEDEFEKIDKFQMDNSIRMVLKEFLNY